MTEKQDSEETKWHEKLREKFQTQSDRLHKATERQLLSTDRFIKSHNTASGTLNTSAV